MSVNGTETLANGDLDTDFDRVVGERIRLFRKIKGINQEELASRIGRSRGTVSNIEAGRQAVSGELLWRIAREVGMPMDMLVDGPVRFGRQLATVEVRAGMAQQALKKALAALDGEFDMSVDYSISHLAESYSCMQ